MYDLEVISRKEVDTLWSIYRDFTVSKYVMVFGNIQGVCEMNVLYKNPI